MGDKKQMMPNKDGLPDNRSQTERRGPVMQELDEVSHYIGNMRRERNSLREQLNVAKAELDHWNEEVGRLKLEFSNLHKTYLERCKRVAVLEEALRPLAEAAKHSPFIGVIDPDEVWLWRAKVPEGDIGISFADAIKAKEAMDNGNDT